MPQKTNHVSTEESDVSEAKVKTHNTDDVPSQKRKCKSRKKQRRRTEAASLDKQETGNGASTDTSCDEPPDVARRKMKGKSRKKRVPKTGAAPVDKQETGNGASTDTSCDEPPHVARRKMKGIKAVRSRQGPMSSTGKRQDRPTRPQPASKGKTVVKSKWTAKEVEAVEKKLMRFILSGQVPRKTECEDCFNAYPDVLKHRDWRSIKYYVHNRITARKRELTSHC